MIFHASNHDILCSNYVHDMSQKFKRFVQTMQLIIVLCMLLLEKLILVYILPRLQKIPNQMDISPQILRSTDVSKDTQVMDTRPTNSSDWLVDNPACSGNFGERICLAEVRPACSV